MEIVGDLPQSLEEEIKEISKRFSEKIEETTKRLIEQLQRKIGEIIDEALSPMKVKLKEIRKHLEEEENQFDLKVKEEEESEQIDLKKRSGEFSTFVIGGNDANQNQGGEGFEKRSKSG